MNAIDFVKEFGLGEARGIIFTMTSGFVNYDGISVNYDEIKQIVDAFDLVEYCNGLENAKELLDEIDSERWVYNLYTNTVISFEYAHSEDMCIRYDALKQAIQLVEKCNES